MKMNLSRRMKVSRTLSPKKRKKKQKREKRFSLVRPNNPRACFLLLLREVVVSFLRATLPQTTQRRTKNSSSRHYYKLVFS